MLNSINPSNLLSLNTYYVLEDAQVTTILDKIEKQFPVWKDISITKRSKFVFLLAEKLLQNKEQLATLASLEMGKPIKQAEGEIEKCAMLCNFYAENAQKWLSPQAINSVSKESWVQYDPIGGVLGVMPWNYPFWQVFRFAIPTIIAGNVALLKHASNVPQCGFAIEQLFIEAGFPEYVFKFLPINSSQVQGVIDHNIIQAVSVTGSNEAGSIVASYAAKQIKKAVLELGGSDAFIVCSDANFQESIDGAMLGRFQNNGQSCIAAKRFLIHHSIYDKFLVVFEQKVRNLKVGDPLLHDTDIGPLAKKEFVNDLLQQINSSIEKGATLRCGGTAIGSHNQYLLPTILENVSPGMPAFDDELFGPVASCIKVNDDMHALELANKSQFGLGASVWTTNRNKASWFADRLNTGTVSVNRIVKSNPRLPFGGVKKSGYGRELSKEGLLEFVNIKTVHIN